MTLYDLVTSIVLTWGLVFAQRGGGHAQEPIQRGAGQFGLP